MGTHTTSDQNKTKPGGGEGRRRLRLCICVQNGGMKKQLGRRTIFKGEGGVNKADSHKNSFQISKRMAAVTWGKDPL